MAAARATALLEPKAFTDVSSLSVQDGPVQSEVRARAGSET